MKSFAERIVDDLLEGRVSDWLSDRWNDVKVATGIGQDSFGMGKPDKDFKPRYGMRPGAKKRPPVTPPPRDRRYDSSSNTWDISP